MVSEAIKLLNILMKIITRRELYIEEHLAFHFVAKVFPSVFK